MEAGIGGAMRPRAEYGLDVGPCREWLRPSCQGAGVSALLSGATEASGGRGGRRQSYESKSRVWHSLKSTFFEKFSSLQVPFGNPPLEIFSKNVDFSL